MEYSKLDIVKSQIEAAIISFFDDDSSVPIHTLAHASESILYDLSKKKDGDFAFNRDVYIKDGCKKEFYKYYNQYANFFKHADQDKEDATIVFSDDVNDFSIMNCCMGYKEISDALTVKMTVFINWFMIFYPECFNLPNEEQQRVNFIKESFKSKFNLQDIDRRRKKLFGKALLQQSNN